MKTIFDSETELGRCDSLVSEFDGERAGWTVLAHTKASMARGMVRIEQRCYLRCGDDVQDHPAIKPEIMLEPFLGSEREMLTRVRRFHEEFSGHARGQIADTCLLFATHDTLAELREPILRYRR